MFTTLFIVSAIWTVSLVLFFIISVFTSLTIPVALSWPISSPKSPVVINSSEANSFLSSSKGLPVASSNAFIIPVNAPVPETGKLAAITTSASVRPAVDNVVATIAGVAQVILAVLTFIPLPDFVGST